MLWYNNLQYEMNLLVFFNFFYMKLTLWCLLLIFVQHDALNYHRATWNDELLEQMQTEVIMSGSKPLPQET